MKKILCIAFIISGFVWSYASAEDTAAAVASGNFVLDADKASDFQLKQAMKENTAQPATEKAEEKAPEPKIITEEIPNGRIEKLLDDKGQVIAEKTIEDDRIVKKVLNYYYPEGKLMRQVTANENDTGFYAEEYYPNGQISSQGMFINEQNKIGIEKKYDINGTLRQEIPWVLMKGEESKNQAVRKTIRQGEIKTYYPAGQLAAIFPIGEKGDTKFFDYRGFEIKKITDSNILNFSKELTDADCQGVSIQLSLEDLIDLYEDEGDISYNKCGLPYRENFVYEIVKKNGNRESKISYDETGMIRRITNYNNGVKDGSEKKYDAAGNLTADINYKKGLKDGEAVGYFPTKEVAFRKTYADGKVVGNLTCYFPSGEIAAEIPYVNGLKDGIAKVNSPVKREIEFSKGEMKKQASDKDERQLVSDLKDFENLDKECLNISDELASIKKTIKENEAGINEAFKIKFPAGCEEISLFKTENNKLVCYDINEIRRVIVPLVYNRGEYASENVYTDKGTLHYEIPYLNKKRQGWAKEYDKTKNVLTEIYYNDGKMSESARTYYPNGQIKEIMTVSDNYRYKLLAYYSQDGVLQFSITYKDNVIANAYINDAKNEKDIAVRYYKGNIDNIRISNTRNPYNFKVYNLALNEYAQYQNSQLVSGGKLCAFDTTEATAQVQSIMTIPEENNTETPVADNTVVAETKTVEPAEKMPEPPVIEAKDAPMIEVSESVISSAQQIAKAEDSVNSLDTAVIPSEEDKKQAELAKRNIGPVAKPGIDTLADVVQKETVNTDVKRVTDKDGSQTEKFFYPSGSIRKTVKTKGTRTEEIKEYSKNGLLLTDTMYNDDKITIEKYFGSGKVRRKTEKNYDDNAVNAFIKRQDFYDNGNPRYEIERQPRTMLFQEKVYDTDGKLKSATVQTGAVAFNTKVYNKDDFLIREINELGDNVFIKEYDGMGEVKNATINGQQIMVSASANEESLLAEKAKVYAYNGKLASFVRKEKDRMRLAEYDTDGQLKTEILFYDNGEISVKSYNSDRILTRFAYIAPDGKLHIEKPFAKIIPAYRERHWIDYNNPRWIENQDRYSIKSLGYLNLDIIANICKDLEMETPEVIKKLYKRYN